MVVVSPAAGVVVVPPAAAVVVSTAGVGPSVVVVPIPAGVVVVSAPAVVVVVSTPTIVVVDGVVRVGGETGFRVVLVVFRVGGFRVVRCPIKEFIVKCSIECWLSFEIIAIRWGLNIACG